MRHLRRFGEGRGDLIRVSRPTDPKTAPRTGSPTAKPHFALRTSHSALQTRRIDSIPPPLILRIRPSAPLSASQKRKGTQATKGAGTDGYDPRLLRRKSRIQQKTSKLVVGYLNPRHVLGHPPETIQPFLCSRIRWGRSSVKIGRCYSTG